MYAGAETKPGKLTLFMEGFYTMISPPLYLDWDEIDKVNGGQLSLKKGKMASHNLIAKLDNFMTEIDTL